MSRSLLTVSSTASSSPDASVHAAFQLFTGFHAASAFGASSCERPERRIVLPSSESFTSGVACTKPNQPSNAGPKVVMRSQPTCSSTTRTFVPFIRRPKG